MPDTFSTVPRAQLIGDSVFTQPLVAPSRRFGRPDPDTPRFLVLSVPAPFLPFCGLFPYSLPYFLCRLHHRCRSTHRPHLLVAAHGPPLVLSGIAFSFLAHTCIPWFR
ncbi:hypothetical protein OPQ81_006831 [Rhizoctonia solani]|nr:hypothetical protein OPQ81_006831 [Rhizoctonia solani]